MATIKWMAVGVTGTYLYMRVVAKQVRRLLSCMPYRAPPLEIVAAMPHNKSSVSQFGHSGEQIN